MRKIKLEVTQKDIDKAKKLRAYGDARNCPVALALRRKLHKKLEVTQTVVYINYINHFTCYTRYTYTNPKVFSFIDRFDASEEVKPFKTTLVLNRDD